MSLEKQMVVAALLLFSCPESILAQTHLNRPIRFVVGNPPGGGQDLIARLIGSKLGEALSVPVVIDNRPGAAGNIAAEVVSKAQPDGHTLLMMGFANAANAGLFKNLTFDLLRDFSAIALAGESTNFLLVPASSPWSSVKDLINEAKVNPGKLNYGSGGNGTVPHLGTELLKRMAGIDIVHVPYRGGGPSMAAVIAREVNLLIANPLNALPQIKAGRVKALGVTSLKRSPAAPSVPAIAESGLDGYEVISWWGVIGPALMPKTLVERYNLVIAQSLHHPDIKTRLESQGIQSTTSTPQAFTVFIERETRKWAKVIHEAGIKPD